MTPDERVDQLKAAFTQAAADWAFSRSTPPDCPFGFAHPRNQPCQREIDMHNHDRELAEALGVLK